jgi:hypothetical protein
MGGNPDYEWRQKRRVAGRGDEVAKELVQQRSSNYYGRTKPPAVARLRPEAPRHLTEAFFYHRAAFQCASVRHAGFICRAQVNSMYSRYPKSFTTTPMDFSPSERKRTFCLPLDGHEG